MKRDLANAESGSGKTSRGTKRRQIPPEVTSAPTTVEDGTSGCRLEEGFAERETAMRDHRNLDTDFELDRMSLADFFREAEGEQEEDRCAMGLHSGGPPPPPPQRDVVLWSVDSSGDNYPVKTMQILASIRANYADIDDIVSPFEDPEILALLPDTSGSTVCTDDSSMDEGDILSTDEHRQICPVPVRLSHEDEYDSLDVMKILRNQDPNNQEFE
ncbi:hypothetical protein M9435_000395 [Picochlorum sp. BPE23]|nr:hypothetical protein M9435_000395 [Picochlorum sp. BPE23]